MSLAAKIAALFAAGGSKLDPAVVPSISGSVVQVVNTQSGAVSTTAATLPFDDTLPQITEGGEFMTRTITPKSAANMLRVDVSINCSPSVSAYITAALFKDSTADALAVDAAYCSGGYYVKLNFTYFMTAGTTSPITFRVRAGGHIASTVTLNGDGGLRRLGGGLMSSITVTEIAA